MNRQIEPMTEADKHALARRGCLCRPVGWSRNARRAELRERRIGRARGWRWDPAPFFSWRDHPALLGLVE